MPEICDEWHGDSGVLEELPEFAPTVVKESVMYLTVDQSSRAYVFTEEDPRAEGYLGEVQEDVLLDDDFPEILRNVPPEHWLGISKDDASHYRVFPSREDCESAGFQPLGTRYQTVKSLADWRRVHQHG